MEISDCCTIACEKSQWWATVFFYLRELRADICARHYMPEYDIIRVFVPLLYGEYGIIHWIY